MSEPCPHCGCPYPGDHTQDCPEGGMVYRLYNVTIQRWVLDEDDRVTEYASIASADSALQKVNDLKQLNPDHANDRIIVTAICS